MCMAPDKTMEINKRLLRRVVHALARYYDLGNLFHLSNKKPAKRSLSQAGGHPGK